MNGAFSWTDGTSWDYENLANGRPDNLHKIENCVNMYANNNFLISFRWVSGMTCLVKITTWITLTATSHMSAVNLLGLK